jgi:hypothetical protein
MYTPLLKNFHSFLTILRLLYNILGTDVPIRKVRFMKEQYILQINEQLENCNDIALLDLILQILNKSV